MDISVFRSKLHRGTVTDADLEYEGSVSIDPKLCEAAKIHIYQKVDIYNCNNGARFSTYVIKGKDGEICLNGAAARHAQRGDKVIIVTYGMIDETEIENHRPVVVLLDEGNKIKKIDK